MNFLDKLEFLMTGKSIKNLNVFSDLSGIPYTTLKEFYTKGTDDIKLSTLEKIKNYFDVTLDYLLDDEITDPEYGKTIFVTVTRAEQARIIKYRALDEHGKKALGLILNHEFDRISATQITHTVTNLDNQGLQLPEHIVVTDNSQEHKKVLDLINHEYNQVSATKVTHTVTNLDNQGLQLPEHMVVTDNNKEQNSDKYIVNDPKIKSRKRTIIETFLLSIVNILLLAVSIICMVVLWSGTTWYIYLHLFTPENIMKATINMFLFFGVWGLIVFLVLILWQQYNYRTYGKLNRRKFPRPVSVQDLATVYQTSSAAIMVASQMRRVSLIKDGGNVVLFDEANNRVTVKPPRPIDFR